MRVHLEHAGRIFFVTVPLRFHIHTNFSKCYGQLVIVTVHSVPPNKLLKGTMSHTHKYQPIIGLWAKWGGGEEKGDLLPKTHYWGYHVPPFPLPSMIAVVGYHCKMLLPTLLTFKWSFFITMLNVTYFSSDVEAIILHFVIVNVGESVSTFGIPLYL